ncbi:MAG: trypsin-like peptidase domain-containing protein [Phycisphaerales bacterium]
MRIVGVALVCVLVVLGGCTITGMEETARREAWPANAEVAFGCTPVSLDLLGSGIRGSGSGVFVSERWILTAAHVIPEGSQYVWLWVDSPTGPVAMVLPIEVIISGGGEPVEAGDWALIRVPDMAERLGAQPARLVDQAAMGEATLVGFPTEGGLAERDQRPTPSPRQAVVLRSDPPEAVSFLDEEEAFPLRYFRMVRGWSALGGASGGPVVVRDASGRPGVAGIVLGRVEYRGLWRRGRAIVTHAVPPQAFLAARGVLDALPSREDGVLLVRAGVDAAPTLDVDGNGVPQRQAASGR